MGKLAMRLPVIQGIIKRRLLVNFRADPSVVQRILPQPFRPKLHRENAVVGICLIRLERMRPSGFSGIIGFSSENAAHRIAVEWTDESGIPHEGVFVPHRHTGSLFNRLAGGRAFPGEQQAARFSVLDTGNHIELSMRSLDGSFSVKVTGDDADSLPASSCFASLREASSFFEGGSLGYSVTRDGHRLDGLLLKTHEWRLRALAVTEVYSSFFADRQRFPQDSIEFDHALVMRDIPHEWHKVDDLYTLSHP